MVTRSRWNGATGWNAGTAAPLTLPTTLLIYQLLFSILLYLYYIYTYLHLYISICGDLQSPGSAPVIGPPESFTPEALITTRETPGRQEPPSVSSNSLSIANPRSLFAAGQLSSIDYTLLLLLSLVVGLPPGSEIRYRPQPTRDLQPTPLPSANCPLVFLLIALVNLCPVLSSWLPFPPSFVTAFLSMRRP